MGQAELLGKDHQKALQSLIGVSDCQPGVSKLTALLSDKGGIEDDLFVCGKNDRLHLILNAGNTPKDLGLMEEHFASMRGKGMDVTLVHRPDLSLMALQGPSALQTITDVLGVN